MRRNWLSSALAQSYNKNMLRDLAPLFAYMRRYRWGYLWGTLSCIATNTVAVQFPRVLGIAVDRMEQGHATPTDPGLRRAHCPDRSGQGHVSLLAALDSDRHLARDRVRPAQRPVPQPGDAGLGLLSALPHRRHHGAHDQRPERGAHAAGPGADVQRQYGLLHRLRALFSCCTSAPT